MKLKLILGVLLLALLIGACSPTQPPAQPADETVAPFPVHQSYPEPIPAYPSPAAPENAYPAATEAAPAGMLYPEIGDGSQVTWAQATAILMNGEVKQVVQSHDLAVFITLSDGRTLQTTEGTIDDIMKLIEQCGEPCKSILIATE